MGVFDLPGPLFQAVDDSLAFMPAVLRLSLWSALAGIVSMLLYALLSPQQRIGDAKVRLREAQSEMAQSDESFDELMGLVKKTLGLSLQHLALVFTPALGSAIPLICVLAWASTHFGHRLPDAGEKVAFAVHPAEQAASLQWQARGVEPPTTGENGWLVTWPAEGGTLTLLDSDGAALLEVPPPAPVPQVHQQLWWNSLLGNPAGYLPGTATVERVAMDLPARRYIPFDPAWVGSWLTLFLIVSVIAAVVTKVLFRIH